MSVRRLAIAMVAASALVAMGIARADLVAHYTFDGPTGTEDSAGSHDGVLIGARGGATIVAAEVPSGGPGNKVLYVNNPTNGFEDFAQCMRVADHPDFHFTNTMTIAVWFYALPADPKNSVRVVDQSWQHSWSLEVNPSKRRVTTQGIPGLPQTPDNAYEVEKWHHAAMVYDFDPDTRKGTAKVYVDGVEKVSVAVTSRMNTSTREILIGGTKDNKYATAYAFHGYIDDVRIYNTALTRAEIAAIRNARPTETIFIVDP